MADNSALFTSLKAGDVELKHRIVHAAMTRLRNDPVSWGPNDNVAQYYAQRATPGGLLLTEAAAVCPTGRGYVRGPNWYDDSNIEGWKKVTAGVHAKGGLIFGQLWHAGRVSHPKFMPEGESMVSASDLPMAGELYVPGGVKEPYGKPRALSTEEVEEMVKTFAKAARRAVKEAGCDGVELHGGNGYLIQEFLAAKTNTRTDKYGGSVAGRCTFLLELVDAVVAEVGAGRVGVKLQPGVTFEDLIEPLEDVQAQLAYLGPELSKRGLAFVELSSLNDEPYFKFLGLEKPNARSREDIFEFFRARYTGTLVVNGGLGIEAARTLVSDGVADAASFGVHFIANPGLVELVKGGKGTGDLNQGGWDMKLWYGKDPADDVKGYIDWPLQ